MNGSQGNKACSVCGSSMPHMSWGTDSCEWDPKWAQTAKDRAKTIEELVTEVSGLSTQLHDALAREAALQERVQKLEEERDFIKAVDSGGLLYHLKDIIELADDAMKLANRDGAEYDRAGELAGARAAINAIEHRQASSALREDEP